jgi:ubiquinone/menaquinone biosynthesis C-methylase UbiE
MDPKRHWESLWSDRSATGVSWYQPQAGLSLAMIVAAASRQTPVIDVGGGASVLADDLLAAGFEDVTVIDLAAAALAAARIRLGNRAAQVRWLEGDITTIPLPAAAFGLWHDRAAFHFLTAPDQQAAYVRQLRRALQPDGHALIATFAEDGPSQCSGLPVQRHSPASLQAVLGTDFELLRYEHEVHTTPTGHAQAFQYCLFRFRPGAT